MSYSYADLPPGGAAGDVYLLHVTSAGTLAPTVTCDGFTSLHTAGQASLWGTWLVRPYDGLEPSSFVADGASGYCLTECVLLRGGDPTTPIVYGTDAGLTGDKVAHPLLTVPAVTTTVANSLVLVGFAAWRFYGAGPAAIAAGVDGQVLSHGADAAAVWSLAQAATATVGPWDIDRTNEDPGNDQGVVGWSLIVNPTGGGPTPTIVAYSYLNGLALDAPTGPAPPARIITNPNPPYQSVEIGGATLAEQNDLIDDQFAAWAAAADAPADATEDYYAHATEDYDAMQTYLTAFPAGTTDAELIVVTQALSRLMLAIGLDPH